MKLTGQREGGGGKTKNLRKCFGGTKRSEKKDVSRFLKKFLALLPWWGALLCNKIHIFTLY